MSDLKEFCNFENDIAILELDKDVSFDETPPICLPSEGHEMMKELLLVGAGRGGRYIHVRFLLRTFSVYSFKYYCTSQLISRRKTGQAYQHMRHRMLELRRC